MIRRLQTFLLTLLVSLASTLSYADEISATLEHTAGTGWSSAASNTPTVDSEQEYYNLDTNTGWAGIAFAKFSFAIPDGQTITSATLTWACKQYNGSQYASTIYYLNEGVNVDFDNFASMDPLSNYRMADQRTWIEDHEKLQGAKTGKLHTGLTTDVTAAVQAINDAGQSFIIFQWTNNSGSAHLQGKVSENAPVLTITTADATTSTSYTIKFVDAAGNELKQPVVYSNVIIGAEATASDADMASFFNEDKTVKYVYASGNATISLAKDAAQNVIRLVFREAETWSYSVVNNFGETMSTGSNLEGEAIRVNFPRYIVSDSQLFSYSKYSSKNKIFCFQDITLTENNQVVNIEYTDAEKSNIRFLAEGEDIEGMTLSSADNSDIRCSNGKCGYNAGPEDLAITTLNPGKYVLSTSVWGNKTTTFSFKAGANEILSIDSKGYINDGSSEEFTIEEPTTIYLTATENAGRGIDFIYIQQTGIVEQVVTTETATINFKEMADEPVSSSSSNAGDITEERTFNVGSSTLLVTPSNATTPNRFWSTSTGPQLRVYGGYLVVTAPEGKAVTNVSINQGKWNSSNTFNGEASATSEWTGNSTNLMIGIAANTQINSITVTTDAATDATTTYVPTVTSINAVKALPLETEVKFELNSVKTTLWSARAWTMYSYIEDATGAMAADMNISNFLYEIIPFGKDIDEGADVRMEGTLWATRSKDSNGIPTLTLSEKTGTDSQVSFTQIEIEPSEAAVATVLKDSANNFRNYLCKYISFSNVTLSKEVVDEYTTNYYIVSGEDSILMYDQYWQLPTIIPDYESIEKIPGFVGIGWDGTFEFHPYGKIEGTLKPAVQVESIGALKQLDDMSNVTLTLNNAQIKVYAAGWWSSEVFIEDETGGIKVDQTIIDLFPDYFDKAGRTFTGELNCYYMNEYGSRYISVNELTTAQSELTVGEAEVVPTTVTLAEAVTAPYEGRLVTIEAPEVTTDEEGYTLFITQGETTVEIMDKFNAIPVDDNWNYVLYDKVKSATGLMLESAGEILFLPYGENAFVEDTATGINELKNSNDANQPLFNLRGMKVQNTKGLKGLYIQNGKKVMFK